MSLININSVQNKGTDKVSFFSHAGRHLHSDPGPIVHTLECLMFTMKIQIRDTWLKEECTFCLAAVVLLSSLGVST